MTPQLWQRLKPLYHAALEAPPDQRPAWMERACGNDPELRAELEALLALGDGPTDSLDQPLVNFRAAPAAYQRSLADGELLQQGRFKIVRLLGTGGMGEVYEAEDRFLRGVHVALKTILPEIASYPGVQQRFEREVLLAREVSHPNLCPIYDIFHCEERDDSFLFLTMKLLPGWTLSARLRGAPIPREEGLAVLNQMASGLAAIHAAGIVHRDIKPNNVMLDGNGASLRLWITDFGLAYAHETESTLSGVGKVAGTPGYIAPELLLPGHLPSQASDLFAFGVVLHEVFAGAKPMPAEDGSYCAVSPRLAPPNVPSHCVELVKECLHNEPKRRCAAFERALEMIDPNAARTRSSARTQKSWTRRRFVGTAAAGVCVMSAGAWWERDKIEDIWHPLPQKRFVALLNWPKASDVQLMPTLTGVLTAIKDELSRAEAFDRDLFVISPEDSPDYAGPSAVAAKLKEICDPLGANLVLAATALPGANHFQLLLRLLDPPSGQTIREKKVNYTLAEITSLPAKAVHAAGSLLDISRYLQGAPRAGPGTQSAAAFTAFQSAQVLMNEPNNAGLDAAIEKYKQAVGLDPQYALAHAELALAYTQHYVLKEDPDVLDLARGNCEHALALDPGLVYAHLAKAVLLEKTGREQAALDEFVKALALDPSNPETLWEQAQVYVRLNRWKDAERSYERIIGQRPNSWVPYNEMGYALHRQGRYPEAVQAFRTATLAAPGSSMAFANLGGEYLEIGDFAEAAKSLKESMAIHPNDLASANASLALRAQGKHEEALPFALKAVELNPSLDVNWLELGDCYSSMGNRPKEAKAAYLRAAKEAERHLRTDATDGPSWMLLALYEAKSGNAQSSLAHVQKAESLGAVEMDSQLCKARILEVLGDRDGALATLGSCFRKGATALQIAPVPDFRSLRKDSRYRQLVQSIAPAVRETA